MNVYLTLREHKRMFSTRWKLVTERNKYACKHKEKHTHYCWLIFHIFVEEKLCRTYVPTGYIYIYMIINMHLCSSSFLVSRPPKIFPFLRSSFLYVILCWVFPFMFIICGIIHSMEFSFFLRSIYCSPVFIESLFFKEWHLRAVNVARYQLSKNWKSWKHWNRTSHMMWLKISTSAILR